MLALVACSANFITRPSFCQRVLREFSHLQEQEIIFFYFGFVVLLCLFLSLQVSLLFPTPGRISKLFQKSFPSSGVLYEHGSAAQLAYACHLLRKTGFFTFVR